MSDSSPQKPTEAPSVWASVEATGQRVENRLMDLQRTQKTTRNWLLLFAVIMVFQIALFIVAGYARIQANFQPDQIRAAAMASLVEIYPDVQREMMAISQNVLPLYQERALARIEQSYPEFRDAAIAEFEKFPEELSVQAALVLQASLNRTINRLDGDLAEAFPVLQHPAQRQGFIADMEVKTSEMLEDKRAEMQVWLNAELQRVSDAFFEFDPAPTPGDDEPSHEQQLIRTLLQIIDEWIVSDDPMTSILITEPLPGDTQ